MTTGAIGARMCGRMSLFVPVGVLENRFNATFAESWTPRYNIAPRQDLAVVPNADPDSIEQYEWSLIPSWVDDPDDLPTLINARAESVATKNSFREAFQQRRCLVLADGFFEWSGERGHKQPYRVTRKDEEPFAFAGLWETWGSNGDTRETVTIVTTEANDVMSKIHDRMPVMLAPEEESRWLEEDDPDELQQLLDPFTNEETESYPISKRVNDPGNDSPDVIEAVEIGDQSGLGDFY